MDSRSTTNHPNRQGCGWNCAARCLKDQPAHGCHEFHELRCHDLGNHEFNFGSDVFQGVLGQATFPLLQANVAEDPLVPYGLAAVGVEPYVEKTVGRRHQRCHPGHRQPPRPEL